MKLFRLPLLLCAILGIFAKTLFFYHSPFSFTQMSRADYAGAVLWQDFLCKREQTNLLDS